MNVDPDRFFRDLLADAMSTALAHQWRDRARALRAARPRPGDFPGRASVEELRDRWRRLTQLAEMCEAKADLIDAAKGPDLDLLVPELDDFPIGEAA